ncbi:MAG: hypothetical protein EP343_31005 [Deltaproteobacteria bacterium]|nr:MAG: hypothetical protein EP343_31005 [Deltaproteobacteria bacterium]
MFKAAQSYLKLSKLLLAWETRSFQAGGGSPERQQIAQLLEQAGNQVEQTLGLLAKAETLQKATPGTTPSSPTGNPAPTPEPTPQPSGENMPQDGRYTLSGEQLSVALRVDLNGSGIISGDIFQGSSEDPVFLASFRSNPGATLTQDTNPVGIVLEGPKGLRGAGSLSCDTSTDTQTTFTCSLSSIVNGPWSPGQSFSWSGSLQGPEMRQLGIELETEAGLDNFPSWDHNGETKTVDSCLKEAGFAIRYVGQRDSIPSHPRGEWDEAQLHGLMHQFAQERLDRPTWNLHLLLLQQARMRGLLGIMFDSGQRDVNHLPRQGVAVFQRPIQTRPDWQRKIIQTTVHELGHALNLAHRFERIVGRADSNSFMNYDWKYRGGGQANEFWNNFNFTFDKDELDFLRHGPWHHIVPGGAPFHTVPYWENTAGGYVPYIPEEDTSDLSLSLQPPASGNRFQFGQPVYLTVSLKNESQQNIPVHKFMLSPKSGFLQVQVQRQDGAIMTADHGHDEGHDYHPIVHRCYDIAADQPVNLAPGSSLSDNLNLTFGSAGFTFAEPGTYTVKTTFLWRLGAREFRTINSAPITIHVEAPSPVEEAELSDFFRWDVGFYFALGGSDVLSEAEQTLLEIVDRRKHRLGGALDPLSTCVLRSRAINLGRDFVSYSNGNYQIRNAQEELAREEMAQITEAGEFVFDYATTESNQAYYERLSGDMDVSLLDE